MKPLVLDASLALGWLFERADSREADVALRTLDVLPDTPTFVPALWHSEIGNALLVAERRRVITEAQSLDFLNRLDALPLQTDPTAPGERRDQRMALAREHGLTLYDATYLELALRLGAVLATFDRALASAMQRAGGTVFA